MPLARKQRVIRRAVAERAGNCCEYCRITRAVSTSEFEVEHIEPTAEGGADELDNLAWSCRRCNSNKGITQASIDPQDGEIVPLFHPRKKKWDTHFAWDSSDDTQLVAKTAIGRATLAYLQLNRPELLLLRRLLKYEKLHPPSVRLETKGKEIET